MDWLYDVLFPALSYVLSYFIHGRRRGPSQPPMPPIPPVPPIPRQPRAPSFPNDEQG